jgi:hypothetical protein
MAGTTINRDELISQREACLRYGGNLRTLRSRIQAGEIPTFRDALDKRPVLVRIVDLENLAGFS